MCLLTYFPAGIEPNTDLLYNGTITNRDGHGFAIVAGKRLIVRHGMNAADTIDRFAKLRHKHPSGPALFHSRFGTGGKFSSANCHPFRVGGDRRTVVAHNGVSLNPVIKPDHRCDTRIAAEEYLPSAFGHLSKPTSRIKLAKWIGPHNKLVILTVNPEYNANAYLINASAGEWDEGIWYSNDGYLPMPESKYYSDGFDRCDGCGSWDSVDLALGECMECGMCAGCGEDWESNCQCAADSSYYVARARRDDDLMMRREDWRAADEYSEWWRETSLKYLNARRGI